MKTALAELPEAEFLERVRRASQARQESIASPILMIRKREEDVAQQFIDAVGCAWTGDPYGSHHHGSKQQPKPAVKCTLPSCNNLTTHNGGYCSPAHCREHRSKTR